MDIPGAKRLRKEQSQERALPAAVRPRNHVIPNGVDLERFRPIPRSEARARLGCLRRRKMTPNETSTKANRVPMLERSAASPMSTSPAGIPTAKHAIQVDQWGVLRIESGIELGIILARLLGECIWTAFIRSVGVRTTFNRI